LVACNLYKTVKCCTLQSTMTKHFKFTATVLLILATAGQSIYGQVKAITYSNNLNAYYSETRPKDTLLGFRFFEPKINEITLNPDTTFQFWSRPNVSCFTWHSYKGTWKKNNDTLFFYDNYQVEENNTKATYKRGSKQEFAITFKTDKGSVLKNKSIKIEYEYDYDAHIESPEKIFALDVNNSVVISYKDIPNFDKLASIRIEYLLNYTEKRYNYLTENKTFNVRQRDIPNIINVEFVERPQKHIVYRTIRAIVKNDTLRINSISKTQTILPDYYSDIEFEDSYSLNK
ncbi:hypothetical protein, partial [Parasediminibacterium sp. JCM 36343]|uniref:hypothetical protein n=1 Tax=Parasediminibacterium sp. JCM 36343 TaxID=3374279 RepID=UPI00397E6869